MRATLMINGKPEFVIDNHHFADVLEAHIGYEAAQFYNDSIDEAVENVNPCNGECDATYELQEHYENLLRDIQDEIMSWDVKKLTKQEIADKRDMLYKMIDKEL